MKFILFFFALLISSLHNANAVGVDVKIHPFSYMVGIANVEVEFLVADNLGVSTAMYYLNMSDEYETYKIKDIGLNFNYYFSTHHEASVYFTPFIHYLEVEEDTGFSSSSNSSSSSYDCVYGYDCNDTQSGNGMETALLIGMSLGYRTKTEANVVLAGDVGFASNYIGDYGVEPLPFPIISLMVGYSF